MTAAHDYDDLLAACRGADFLVTHPLTYAGPPVADKLGLKWASGALQPVLYHVNPRDRMVFAAVVATLALASLIASFLPARRVTRIDPALALAAE